MTKWLLISFLITSLDIPSFAHAGQEAVAILNGEPIMSQHVESRAATKLYRLRWEIYDTLRTEAQALVDELLLAQEAEQRGLTAEQLLGQEVDEKSTPATEADIDAYIAEHDIKDAGEETRSRIRTYLTDRDRIQRKLDFLEELREKAHYKFLLEEPERPRAQVSVDDDPTRGPSDAPITIIHFASFSCEHCAESAHKIQRLTEEFPGAIRWAHRDFINIFDERGLMAAEAGEMAKAQGKFWEFHDYIYSLSTEFEQKDLPRLLSEAGVDAAQFEKAHKEASYILEIKHDIEDGVAAGVTGVPAIFINGRHISGTFAYEKLKEMVGEELRLADNKTQKASAPLKEPQEEQMAPRKNGPR